MRSIRVALAGLIGVALAFLVVMIGPSMARADTTCYTGCTTTVVPGTTVAPKVAPITGQQPSVLPAVLSSGTTANSSGLAFTGADIAGTVAIGLIAVAGGGVLVRVSRRRRARS